MDTTPDSAPETDTPTPKAPGRKNAVAAAIDRQTAKLTEALQFLGDAFCAANGLRHDHLIAERIERDAVFRAREQNAEQQRRELLAAQRQIAELRQTADLFCGATVTAWLRLDDGRRFKLAHVLLHDGRVVLDAGAAFPPGTGTVLIEQGDGRGAPALSIPVQLPEGASKNARSVPVVVSL